MNTRRELLRQSIHAIIGTALIIGYASGLLQWWTFFTLIVAGLLLVLISQTSGLLGIDRLIARIERKDAFLPGWGALTLLGGFLLVSLLFNRVAGLIGLIVLVYGDAAATIAGKIATPTPLAWNRKKSYQGLIAGLIVSSLIISILVGWRIGLLCSATGMLVESAKKPRWLDDNLLIPLITGALTTILL